MSRREDILEILKARFGPLPFELATALRLIVDEQQLRDLILQALTCPDLEEFRLRLSSAIAPDAPV